jgi:transposase
VPRRRGRPRKRPARLLGDRAYTDPPCRRARRRRGIAHTIPERRDQRAAKGRRGGRPPGFDRAAYRRRNGVERCVNRLTQARRGATRYAKRAARYRAFAVLAAIQCWLAP